LAEAEARRRYKLSFIHKIDETMEHNPGWMRRWTVVISTQPNIMNLMHNGRRSEVGWHE